MSGFFFIQQLLQCSYGMSHSLSIAKRREKGSTQNKGAMTSLEVQPHTHLKHFSLKKKKL
jgi:hypothetical protein